MKAKGKARALSPSSIFDKNHHIFTTQINGFLITFGFVDN
jgi:hypothetical protein